jgi:outer membrane protein insertion porin family
MDVASLIVESSSKPVQVNLVKVEGVVHTSYDFLDFIVRDLLSARSVGELVVGSRNVGSQLRRLGIFKDVGVSINATPGKENSVDVVYKVVESPRVYAKQGATFGQQDAKMVSEI